MQTAETAELGRSPPKRQRKPKAGRTNGKALIADIPAVINLSGIRATEFNVVVKPDNFEEVTKGGVIIPQLARENQAMASMQGVIVHVSPVAFTYERWPEDGEPKPKAGDRVVIAKYCGMIVKGKDGIEYRVVKDKDIVAVIA